MPALIKSPPLQIPVEPLTADAFHPFGAVIPNPHPSLSPSTLNVEKQLPENGSIANQNTAIKYSHVTLLSDLYTLSRRPKALPSVSLFSCYPRTLVEDVEYETTPGTKDLSFDVRILERHPFTSQTFVPLGLSSSSTDTCYLVIAAPDSPPTKPNALHSLRSALGRDRRKLDSSVDPPDLSKMCAFLARGDQAVTYGPGTWHAPMVVLGSSNIDFVVWQYANGVSNDDCQEVLIKPAETSQRGPVVRVPSPSKWAGILGTESSRAKTALHTSKL